MNNVYRRNVKGHDITVRDISHSFSQLSSGPTRCFYQTTDLGSGKVFIIEEDVKFDEDESARADRVAQRTYLEVTAGIFW